MRRLLALVLLTGCGQAAPSSAPPPAPPPAVQEASVLQYRRDAAREVLQVRVVPARDARLDAVRLVSARFPGSPQVPEDARLRAGQPVALPVPHGAPDCAVPAGAPASAELVVDGARVAVPVPTDALDRVADRLCAAAALAAQVRLAVRVTSTDGPVATAELVVTRGRSDAELAVTGFGGNVLLALEPAAPLPVLPPGQDAARLPLRLRAARCDPHALAESKQTSTLRVFVRVGAAEPQQVVVLAGPADARALEEWVVRACR